MRSSSFASAQAEGAASATFIEAVPAVGDSRCAPTPSVSAVRQAEDALDREIKDLDHKAVHARAVGDHAKCRELIDRMYALIRGRTPEHQDRLAREAWARQQRELDEGVDFFQVQGRLSRARASGG